ncbi:outer membrane protein [Mesorhizobium tianshanense]|uniref:Outer membrane protein n=1 Tax=Mesorhizobium tianshanense TaxID=39844 RepID=A0A562MKE3_9HYPH|nr:OmpW family protein [Mesorhizobium tianshanense]TWI20374.1 outer membrane protein [Mesorhizobium tianshanense]GLS40653.1 outer membrane protein [Mesorhizobium tianshanense]
MATKRIGVARGVTAAVILIVVGQQAVAADLAQAASVPRAGASVTEAPSPWQIRLRGLGVITKDSGYVNAVPGSGLSYSNTVTPELDITYFFTDNIAAELILGTTYANIDGQGTIGGLGNIGKVWLLPPTLTLQYHFTDFGAFKPYVGAGVNYTIFYNQDAGSADALRVKNTFGTALQVGFDYMVDQHWGVNFDVKKLFLKPDFDVTVDGAKLTGKAALDPWLIGAGVTYRF